MAQYTVINRDKTLYTGPVKPVVKTLMVAGMQCFRITVARKVIFADNWSSTYKWQGNTLLIEDNYCND